MLSKQPTARSRQLTSYGEHEPYTRQGLLEFGGCFLFVAPGGSYPAGQDRKRQLLPADTGSYRKGDSATRFASRMLGANCGGSAADQFRTRQTQVQRLSAAEQAAGKLQVRGRGVQHHHRRSCHFSAGLRRPHDRNRAFAGRTVHAPHGLGGWTVDLMRIDNAIPAADTAHSLELGMIRCVDDIREQVRRETGLSLTDAQIENMLAGQPCTVSDTVRDIVNRQGRKYTEHLLSATMEAGFDLHAIPAVLLGGGASVVSRHLSPKDGLCKTIFLLDDKVNAGGFERALAAVSRRKSEA